MEKGYSQKQTNKNNKNPTEQPKKTDYQLERPVE